MTLSAIRRRFYHSCLFGALLVSAPLVAQSFEELDALSDASVSEETGLETARDQASRGEYLEALATLERTLAVHPKSREGRLMHALYLCRIDDVQGGLVEISRLKEKHYSKDLLKEARALCNGEEA